MAQTSTDRYPDNHAYHLSGKGSDEAVRILVDLTGDFERFDSMIHDQLSMFEHQASRLNRARDVDRESQRFRREAAEMAMRIQKALTQLSQLAEPGRPRRHRDPVRLGRERRTG